MRPLLEHLADGAVKSNHETIDVLSKHFLLTDEELAELLPSGQQSVFTNRVAWAKAHLKKAGLLESPSRGLYKVTPRGLDALAQSNQRINLKYLKQFEVYNYGNSGNSNAKEKDEQKPSDTLTPSEHIEIGYQRIREELEERIAG